MSRRQYPFYAGRRKTYKPPLQAKCEVCEQPATHRVEFQYSWFRGDDEETRVCDSCGELAKRDAFLFHDKLHASQP